ncbi:MAG: M91 family zinc metallopeptidase [Bacteroidia bacterium]
MNSGWGGMMAFTLSDRRRGARMYAPDEGRWKGGDALAEKYYAISPFAYVANNPLLFTDPNGEEIWVVFSEVVRDENGEVMEREGKPVTQNFRYMYDGEKLVDEDGNEYMGTKDFAVNALKALNHLKASGASEIVFGEGESAKTIDIIDELMKTGEEVQISYKSGIAESADMGGRLIIIGFDPSQGIDFLKDYSKMFPTTEDRGRNSATARLGHELIHAYNRIFDYDAYMARHEEKYDKTVFPFFPNAEEKMTTLNWGNQINRKLGEDERTNYRRIAFPTISPTSTEKKKE